MTLHIYTILSALLIGCTPSTGDHNRLTADLPRHATSAASQISLDDDPIYDGLYLNEWNNSGILIIYKGKIHHYNRNEPTSMYKDEEYDYKGLHTNGRLHINRTYRLDRKDNVVSKETVLSDIEPIIENRKTIALVRNGRKFNRMDTFSDLLNSFPSYDVSHIESQCAEELSVPSEVIQEAVQHPKYYMLSGLHFRQLRDGQITFKEILKNTVKNLT